MTGVQTCALPIYDDFGDGGRIHCLVSLCSRIEHPLGEYPLATQQGALVHLLAKLLFEPVDQPVSLALNFVLPDEEIATLGITQLIHLALLLLGRQLLRQCGRAFALAASFLDAPTQFLDFALKPNLQVISPRVEFLCFVGEQNELALLDAADARCPMPEARCRASSACTSLGKEMWAAVKSRPG